MRTRTIVTCLVWTLIILAAGCSEDNPAAPAPPGGGLTAFNTSQLPDTFASVAYGNLAFGCSGNLMFADRFRNLYEWDRSTGIRSTVATDIGVNELLCAVFDPKRGVVYVGNDQADIFTVDPSDGSSQLLTHVDSFVEVQQLLIAPSGYGGFGGMLLAASAGSPQGVMVVDPDGVAADSLILSQNTSDIEFAPDGTLYAALYYQSVVVSVTPDGNTTVFADSLDDVEGIAIDSDGSRMWVAITPSPTQSIVEITIPGEKKTVLASPAMNRGYYPSGLAYDGFGNLIFLHGTGISQEIIDFMVVD